MTRETLPTIIHVNCPQQSNSYDCGIYTVLYADKIASFLFSDPTATSSTTISLTSDLITQAVENITPTDCYQFRYNMLSVIHNLIEEANQNNNRNHK